jgi:phosphatidylserine decarboxylase
MLPIAREFQSLAIMWTLLSITLSLFATFNLIWIWTIWACFIWFVRDFRRRVPANPLANISPVDGRIVHIEDGQDPYLERQSTIYTIRQFVTGEFNMHSPTEGKLQELWVRNEANTKNLSLWIQTDEHDEVVLEIILASALQHASTHIHPGERIGQGQRLGFTAIGCMIRVYLPACVKRVGCVGDKVIAGHDTLANFTH